MVINVFPDFQIPRNFSFSNEQLNGKGDQQVKLLKKNTFYPCYAKNSSCDFFHDYLVNNNSGGFDGGIKLQLARQRTCRLRFASNMGHKHHKYNHWTNRSLEREPSQPIG